MSDFLFRKVHEAIHDGRIHCPPPSLQKPRRAWPGQIWSYAGGPPLEVTGIDVAGPHLTRVRLFDGNTVAEHGMLSSAGWAYLGKAAPACAVRVPLDNLS